MKLFGPSIHDYRMDAYNKGSQSARNGEPLWMNPHSLPSAMPDMFLYWLAGWCIGQKLKDEEPDR